MAEPITPQLRVLDALYPMDTAFIDALSGGVTCVQARNYLAKVEDAGKKGEPFERDLGMEALASVLRRETPLRVHYHRLDNIQAAVRIAEKKVYAVVGPTLSTAENGRGR